MTTYIESLNNPNDNNTIIDVSLVATVTFAYQFFSLAINGPSTFKTLLGMFQQEPSQPFEESLLERRLIKKKPLVLKHLIQRCLFRPEKMAQDLTIEPYNSTLIAGVNESGNTHDCRL